MSNDTKLLAEAYELISEKKAKGKDWVPPWAKKEDKKGKCEAADDGCDCDGCAECRDNQKEEEGGGELTAKQKKLPPALQAAMKKKKKKLTESFESLYEEVCSYVEE